jgi:outer membrane protein assembly factor BamB
MSGTFTATDGNTNEIVWQHKMPYRIGQGGGPTTTAGGLVFGGEPDGNFLAFNAKTGEELWRFQTGFGADPPPAVYEVDGEEYVAIATGGNSLQLSANGDAVWVFSLKGQLGPLWPPPPPAGPVADGVNTVKIGDNNVEYAYWSGRTRVKAETAMTFTNVGDVPHTATAFEKGKWGPVQDRHLPGARQLLLHLRAAPLDVRAGHRRIDPKAENACAVTRNE